MPFLPTGTAELAGLNFFWRSSIFDDGTDLTAALFWSFCAKASEPPRVTCVESTSVSGALSHFAAMVRPCWLRRAVRNRHRHAIEQASRRWRTHSKILISTQELTHDEGETPL